jgi:hypothetical protein
MGKTYSVLCKAWKGTFKALAFSASWQTGHWSIQAKVEGIVVLAAWH